jgi:serine protease Do
MRRLLTGLVCLTFATACLGDDTIPLKTLTDLKSATVFIKAEAGREAWSGSGFLMKVEGTTGYVVTNNHVASASGKSPLKPVLTLVFWSGTRQEQAVRAQVLGTDPDRDLALLKCTGVKDLPTPVDLSQKPELVETMPVYVCGFPFGKSLSTTKGNSRHHHRQGYDLQHPHQRTR